MADDQGDDQRGLALLDAAMDCIANLGEIVNTLDNTGRAGFASLVRKRVRRSLLDGKNIANEPAPREEADEPPSEHDAGPKTAEAAATHELVPPPKFPIDAAKLKNRNYRAAIDKSCILALLTANIHRDVDLDDVRTTLLSRGLPIEKPTLMGKLRRLRELNLIHPVDGFGSGTYRVTGDGITWVNEMLRKRGLPPIGDAPQLSAVLGDSP